MKKIITLLIAITLIFSIFASACTTSNKISNPQSGQGGGVIDTNKNPVNPIDHQVSEEIWNQSLDFSKIDKIAFTIHEKQENYPDYKYHYEIDGDKVCKNIIHDSTGRNTLIYYSKDESGCYRYDIEKTDIDMKVTKYSISEIAYHQVFGVKKNFTNYLVYENFTFNEQANCYTLCSPIDKIDYAEVSFYKNQITAIRIISQGIEYQFDNFHINEISVYLPY